MHFNFLQFSLIRLKVVNLCVKVVDPFKLIESANQIRKFHLISLVRQMYFTASLEEAVSLVEGLLLIGGTNDKLDCSLVAPTASDPSNSTHDTLIFVEI